MKIGILGSRGIPNHYGGFEQFAEYLSLGLIKRGVDVWVYNSHTHPYTADSWQGVNLIHCHDPENRWGAAGHFIYDLNCINDSRHRNFDILLQLGYTTNAIWHRRLPSGPKIITNMDGLEWKRSKYSKPIRRFLRYSEQLAVESSHALVADSEAILDYLLTTYQQPSTFIPYGAEIYQYKGIALLKNLGIKPREYFLLIARMQSDNHIEEIIRGVLGSEGDQPLLVIGSVKNSHGRYLTIKYNSSRIKYLGGIFEMELLNQLRHNAVLYFHGHSSGGTNPSLLEAMAASAPICAHDNVFNRSVLGNDAYYFSTPNDITALINRVGDSPHPSPMITNNLHKIQSKYNWEKVIEAYYDLFVQALKM
jgi:glycosyltransferase involved in cell wall biosynthesis